MGLAARMTHDQPFKFLEIACLALWLGILSFGLWPFDFFRGNNVKWLQNENGIHFGRYGQAYSATSWDISSKPTAPGERSFTVEIWLHPWEGNYPGVSAICSIGDGSRPPKFAIAQSGSDLMVRGQFLDDTENSHLRKLWLDDAFHNGGPRFMTLTSGAQGTALYLEGLLQKRYALTLTIDNFFGPILLGHAPAGHQPWTGDLLGLAVYEKALTAGEVSEHYKEWQDANTGMLIASQGVAAFYPFDERTGDVIHNRAGSAPSLLIPARFGVLHPTILSFGFTFDRAGLDDIVINILGFMPFGFVLYAYLQYAKRLGKLRSLLLTVFLGGITSLAIELLQVYLPSRESSLLDLIDNTLGTALGTALHNGIAYIVRRSKVA
jgi:hypothetical protein